MNKIIIIIIIFNNNNNFKKIFYLENIQILLNLKNIYYKKRNSKGSLYLAFPNNLSKMEISLLVIKWREEK